MRIVRMVAHVARLGVGGMPALCGRVGELAGIEPQDARQRTRFVVVRYAVATRPVGDMCGR